MCTLNHLVGFQMLALVRGMFRSTSTSPGLQFWEERLRSELHSYQKVLVTLTQWCEWRSIVPCPLSGKQEGNIRLIFYVKGKIFPADSILAICESHSHMYSDMHLNTDTVLWAFINGCWMNNSSHCPRGDCWANLKINLLVSSSVSKTKCLGRSAVTVWSISAFSNEVLHFYIDYLLEQFYILCLQEHCELRPASSHNTPH